VWVSHGRRDEVLSFATTCRTILSALRHEGAEVSFRPFDGEHEISPDVAEQFLDEAFGQAAATARQPPSASAEPRQATCE
jgi:predicted esterase